MDLAGIATRAGERIGTVWWLDRGEDLNANLVRFPAGRGVEEHLNDEVDVLLVGVSGAGAVAMDGEDHAMSVGALVFVPKGVRRAVLSASQDFAYLSIHLRRGAMQIGHPRTATKKTVGWGARGQTSPDMPEPRSTRPREGTSQPRTDGGALHPSEAGDLRGVRRPRDQLL